MMRYFCCFQSTKFVSCFSLQGEIFLLADGQSLISDNLSLATEYNLNEIIAKNESKVLLLHPDLLPEWVFGELMVPSLVRMLTKNYVLVFSIYFKRQLSKVSSIHFITSSFSISTHNKLGMKPIFCWFYDAKIHDVTAYISNFFLNFVQISFLYWSTFADRQFIRQIAWRGRLQLCSLSI